MIVVFVVASIVSLLGMVIWIALLFWAARADGRDQRERDEVQRQPNRPGSRPRP